MIELILMQRVDKLGQMGELVKVKPGYARNYLLPLGKAIRANKENLARFEAQRCSRACGAGARVWGRARAPAPLMSDVVGHRQSVAGRTDSRYLFGIPSTPVPATRDLS